MTVIAFSHDVSKEQLKQYADVVCCSICGLSDADIAAQLGLPEHLVSAWVKNWNDMEAAARVA